ncbi:F-box-like domain superfamily, partial [Arabidopsis thaliana x Arabidopsis arenosa]
MDKIGGVSEDELLVKILSFLPTKVAVSTSVLSKQWKYLWKRVLKLEYDDTECKTKSSKSRKRFRRFVKRNLQIDRESNLESLSLKFSTAPFQCEDIKSWVRFAVSRGVHQLSIAYSSDRVRRAVLPIHLYTCKSLVSLKLEEDISLCITEYIPRTVCLPSLKNLQLQSVNYSLSNQDHLKRFLSNCPVLENLTLKHINTKRCYSKQMFSVSVPSLQSLSLEIGDVSNFDGYEIDTPSLRYLKIKDHDNRPSCSIVNMPKLEEAYIDVVFPNTTKLLEPIASIKRLSLCLKVNSVEDVYTDGIVFNQLEHLKLCTCNTYWSKLLVQFLENSPKLQVLELYVNEHSPISRTPMVYWKNQLSCLPQCFVTSLETF